VGLIQLSLAPFQGDLWETLSPGLKPRAESSSPFGVENPLQNLKLTRVGNCRTATEGNVAGASKPSHAVIPVLGILCSIAEILGDLFPLLF
jgi:hypothetical protein